MLRIRVGTCTLMSPETPSRKAVLSFCLQICWVIWILFQKTMDVSIHCGLSFQGFSDPMKTCALGCDIAESKMVLCPSALDFEDAWLIFGSCNQEIRNRQKYKSLSQE